MRRRVVGCCAHGLLLQHQRRIFQAFHEGGGGIAPAASSSRARFSSTLLLPDSHAWRKGAPADQNSHSKDEEPSGKVPTASRKRPAVRLSILEFKRSDSSSNVSSHTSHPQIGKEAKNHRPKRT